MDERTRARAVIDLEPGTRTDERTGEDAVGAIQVEAATRSFCRAA
jgi:hypothetical protein